MAADDSDGVGLSGGERKDAAGVLEQDGALLFDLLGVVATAEGVDDAARSGRLVDYAGGEHAADDAVDHVVEAALRDLAAEDGLLERLREEVVVAGLVLVEAGEGGFDGGVGATPIGEDETFEAPVVLEDLVEGVVVLAGVVAVDAVVGAHDAGGMRHGDRDLEGKQVGFAEGAGVELGVEGVAAGLLVVEDVVLDVAHDVVGLHAAGELADHGSGEDGVFAGVLEVAAVAGLADEVHAAADGHVEAHGAEFAADDGAVEEGSVGVPGCGQADDGGKQRGVAALESGHAHPDGGVGEVDVGKVKARDAGNKAGSAVMPGSDGCTVAQHSPAGAVDELDLLIERHLVDHEVGAGVGIERRVHPGLPGIGRVGGRLRSCLGAGRAGVTENYGEAGQERFAADAHRCGVPFVRTHQYTARFSREDKCACYKDLGVRRRREGGFAQELRVRFRV